MKSSIRARISLVVIVGSLLFLVHATAFAQKPAVLVSGGTSGIGRELVLLLIKRGYPVATFGRTRERVFSLKEEVEALRKYHLTRWSETKVFPKVLIDQVDIVEENAVKNFFDEAEKVLQSPIGVVVNNAAVTGTLDTPQQLVIADFMHTMAINVTGPVALIQNLLASMEKHKNYRTEGVFSGIVDGKQVNSNGVTISISSGSSNGVDGAASYSASKAALNAFTWATVNDFSRKGGHAFVFNPGHVETPMTEKVRGTPESKMASVPAFRQFKLAKAADVALQLEFLISHPWLFEKHSRSMISFETVTQVRGNDGKQEAKTSANGLVAEPASRDSTSQLSAALERQASQPKSISEQKNGTSQASSVAGSPVNAASILGTSSESTDSGFRRSASASTDGKSAPSSVAGSPESRVAAVPSESLSSNLIEDNQHDQDSTAPSTPPITRPRTPFLHVPLPAPAQWVASGQQMLQLPSDDDETLPSPRWHMDSPVQRLPIAPPLPQNLADGM